MLNSKVRSILVEGGKLVHGLFSILDRLTPVREGLHNPRRSVSQQTRIYNVKPKALSQRFPRCNAPICGLYRPLARLAGALIPMPPE